MAESSEEVMAHHDFPRDTELGAPPEWLNKKNAFIGAGVAFAVWATIQLCNSLGTMAGAQTGGLRP